MKILTVCAGGNCRSVTLATMLKYGFKGEHDVLACAFEKNSETTLLMLCEWADLILTVDEEIHEGVCLLLDKGRRGARMLHSRTSDLAVGRNTVLIPIGRDEWGMSMHPDLVTKAWPLLIAAGFEPSRTLEVQLARTTKYSMRRGAADPLEGTHGGRI